MVAIATFREILGSGTWLGISILGPVFQENSVKIMIMAPGAFLTIGFLIGLFNWIENRRTSAK
jgi:electron transport complex protein RnfE